MIDKKLLKSVHKIIMKQNREKTPSPLKITMSLR